MERNIDRRNREILESYLGDRVDGPQAILKYTRTIGGAITYKVYANCLEHHDLVPILATANQLNYKLFVSNSGQGNLQLTFCPRA